MYSKLKPFSLMGVSNIPEMFLSEKDLSNAVEFSTTTTFLVRPPLQFQQDQYCQIAPSQQQQQETLVVEQQHQQQEEERLVVEEEEQQQQDHHHQQQQQQKQQQEQVQEEADECKLAVASRPPLELKLPLLGELKKKVDEDEEMMMMMNDGFKTPSCLDKKIPAMLKCPPAPRKPKAQPLAKRKAFGRRILLDLTKEIESLFPPALLADLGNKIKKVRQASDFQ